MLQRKPTEMIAEKTLLSPAELNHYAKNGYLILPNVIPHHVCDALMIRANQLVQEADLSLTKTIFSTKTNQHVKNDYFLESGNNISFFFEEKAFNETGDLTQSKENVINKIGHALHNLDSLFYCFSHLHSIMSIAKELQIIDPVILQSMYIFKQPRIGGEVNCHQDATYLYLHDDIVTGFWFALEDATIENGCLWGIPGGHQGKLKSRMIRNEKNDIHFEYYDKTPFDLTKMVPLEVKKGSLIILHGLFPHMSYENKSPYSRHAYAIHMAARKAHYAHDNWLKHNI